MALSNEDFQTALGDSVRELCALVDVPHKSVISVHVSSEGLEIEYADLQDGATFVRSVKRLGALKFKPERASQVPL